VTDCVAIARTSEPVLADNIDRSEAASFAVTSVGRVLSVQELVAGIIRGAEEIRSRYGLK
jgi:hypothetical protein